MNIKISKLSANLAVLACFSFNAQASQGAAEASATQICSSQGAFAIRFGDKLPATRAPAPSFLFGRGCYLVSPPVTHPFFDTYAACASEFDGRIYQIQAAKIFDDKPSQGSLSLSSAQISSNRKLGQQILDGLLAQLPSASSAQAKVDVKGRSWELLIEESVRLEVSNFAGWAVTFECQNEAMAQQVYQQRIMRNRRQ